MGVQRRTTRSKTGDPRPAEAVAFPRDPPFPRSNKHMRHTLHTLSALVLAGTATAQGPDLHVVYSNDPGSPATAQVPGLPAGTFFNPGTDSNRLYANQQPPEHPLNRPFGRPYASPNGNLILRCVLDRFPTPTGWQEDWRDEVLLLNDVVVVEEDVTVVDVTAPGERVYKMQLAPSVNDAGDFAFKSSSRLGTIPFASDYVVRGDAGGGFTVIAEDGDPIPMLPGETYTERLYPTFLTASGDVGFEAHDDLGFGWTYDILTAGGTIDVELGATVPSGQLGGTTYILDEVKVYSSYDPTPYYFGTHDGSSWLMRGHLAGAPAGSDAVVVQSGAVALQEGTVLPGTDANEIDNILITALDHGSNWYATGYNEVSALNWVARNGQVVALEGLPITSISTESWSAARYSRTYWLVGGNGIGDYFVCGGTDHADATTDFVIVKNGGLIVAREGDALDLDGNGSFDDDAYVSRFLDAELLADGTLYFVCVVRDGTGDELHQAFVSVDTGNSATAFCFGDGSDGGACPCGNAAASGSGEGCLNGTGFGALLSAGGLASVSADSAVLTVSQAVPNDFGIFVQNVSLAGGPSPFYNGLFCLSGDSHLVRHYAPPAVQATFTDAGGVGVNAQPLTVGDYLGDTQPGVTIYYQFWGRDNTGPCGAGANFSSGVSLVWMP